MQNSGAAEGRKNPYHDADRAAKKRRLRYYGADSKTRLFADSGQWTLLRADQAIAFEKHRKNELFVVIDRMTLLFEKK